MRDLLKIPKCLSNRRECQYRPSRRGGARRGQRYRNAKALMTDEPTKTPTPELQTGAIQTSTLQVTDFAGIISPFNDSHVIGDVAETDTSSIINSNLDPALNHDNVDSGTIRLYQNERDLINAYYIFIHPYLPLLPPPTEPLFADRPSKLVVSPPNSQPPDPQSLPSWSMSPFSLSLMAIFVLIPLPDDVDPMRHDAIVLRSLYADMYSKAALESVEKFAGDMEQSTCQSLHKNVHQESPSCLHRDISLHLEPVLALLLLGVYEYCQLGARRQMRSRVYQALTMAMDLSLHRLGERNSEFAPAETRAWWMTMNLAYQSAIFTQSAPILLIHDTRITTPFPEFSGARQLLPDLMQAQEVLLKAGAIARELVDDKTIGSFGLMRDRIHELDALILALAGALEQYHVAKPADGPDAVAFYNLWLNAKFLTHTARIRLHRFRAFGDYPIFTKKFCDMNSIDSKQFSGSSSATPPARLVDVDSVFPFSEQESTNICLKSALALSRVMRYWQWPDHLCQDTSPRNELPGAGAYRQDIHPATARCRYPRSLPYIACAGVQSCYVLMMSLQKIRAALCAGNLAACHKLLVQPEPGTEQQDAERLIEEMRNGVRVVCDFMSSNAIFGSFATMARELETIYQVQFHDPSF